MVGVEGEVAEQQKERKGEGCKVGGELRAMIAEEIKGNGWRKCRRLRGCCGRRDAGDGARAKAYTTGAIRNEQEEIEVIRQPVKCACNEIGVHN